MADREDTHMADTSDLKDTLLTEKELDEKFPNRPRNFGTPLPFHDLYLTLFNPLTENKKKATGPTALARRKVGPHGGPSNLPPHERRRQIIERFISRWRQEVGPDIYPAFRLVLPDRDRDRPMYGLKEKAIGKLLVKIMRINPNSDDGFALLNFKIPGPGIGARMAGDFAGRCYEVLKKRPMRTEPGNMDIGRVNDLLDQLAVESKESAQLPIMEEFYSNMNATEMLWLVRIILRQMKVGATERTIFDIFHPDAVNLYNVTSSLRKVCWDLYDPTFRLDGEDKGITLMQCFQPQLAQFQLPTFQKMVERLHPTEDDATFWMEEKLDGERMQMHMARDVSVPGGMRFAWWSRKAKEYTYLYGNGFMDENAALTRHLKAAFHEGVENCILDGEMITWDPQQDKMVPFGTLKTAAINAQRNPFDESGPRPLYSIFDMVYLNDTVLTNYTLRDRRNALEASIVPVHRRFQIHSYTVGSTAGEIEPLFRQVVETESEGLVLKNPRSPYRPNERCDDWQKVKPDYLGFGETPDCVVIGGYYGSGRRGGVLSSFLCGLRLDRPGADPELCSSFFKVGGGMSAADYSQIRHLTEGKWQQWDPKRPPSQYILLGGADGQTERPDVWIRPSESIVVEVQAASCPPSESFHAGITLRFPRFKRLREDRDWKSALSLQGFRDMKKALDAAEREKKELEFQAGAARRGPRAKAAKREVQIEGTSNDQALHPDDARIPATNVFGGLAFYVLTDCPEHASKRSKAQLEALIKHHGGRITHTHAPGSTTLCIADRRTVHVAGLQKRGDIDLLRSRWVQASVHAAADDRAADARTRARPLPLEREDLFHATLATLDILARSDPEDEWGDSFYRTTSAETLRAVLARHKQRAGVNRDDVAAQEPVADREALHIEALAIRSRLVGHGHLQSLSSRRSHLFDGVTMAFSRGADGNGHGNEDENAWSSAGRAMERARWTALFAGAADAVVKAEAGVQDGSNGTSPRGAQEGIDGSRNQDTAGIVTVTDARNETGMEVGQKPSGPAMTVTPADIAAAWADGRWKREGGDSAMTE